MKTVIFSGTTEGRKLSGMLASESIGHLVCVATEYGSEVMDKSPCVRIHVGRMDSEKMREFLASNGFGKGDIIADATHPYATEVSVNIRRAADTLGCDLIRVGRGYDDKCDGNEERSYVNRYDSVEEFAKRIGSFEGNILLTTGSKELPTYCKNVSPKALGRTYVRVLPAAESLEICEDCGIEKSHVIAMHGPFSRELNASIMKQYDIRHLLTKDSGREGGFDDKIKAAADLGVTVHIITRPESNDATFGTGDGVSVEKAFEAIAGHKFRRKRRIVLAGIGMGSKSGMTQEVIDAIRSADALFGATSVVDTAVASVFGPDVASSGSKPRIYDVYLAGEISEILEKEVDITKAAILFSGDTGFYSGAGEAYRQLSQWDEDAGITVLPGVSSVSYLAARFAVPYDDAKIVSVHGRNGLHNMEMLADAVAANPKVFALMSGDEDVRTIAKMLLDRRIDATVRIGRNLSYDLPDPDNCESIETLSVEEAAEYIAKGKITVLFINDRAGTKADDK